MKGNEMYTIWGTEKRSLVCYGVYDELGKTEAEARSIVQVKNKAVTIHNGKTVISIIRPSKGSKQCGTS